MRFFLALRAIFFVLLLPGTVAGYVPFRILSAADQVRVPELSLSSAGASIVAIAGVVVLLRCIWDFFAKGSGTLAPIDPPRVLVVSGLYRFTRNPMYNGVLRPTPVCCKLAKRPLAILADRFEAAVQGVDTFGRGRRPHC